jgi:hypothetical protein
LNIHGWVRWRYSMLLLVLQLFIFLLHLLLQLSHPEGE